MKHINENRKGYKKTPVGWIPEEWEVKEFGKIVLQRKEKFDPTIELKISKNIDLEHLSSETGSIVGFDYSDAKSSILNRFKKGDVLFGKLRPYLKKYWYADFEGTCSSEIWVLSPRQNDCTGKFLFYLVQSDKFSQISNISYGTKMPRADWNYVSSFDYILPTITEQTAIANILTEWDNAIHKTQKLIDLKEKRKKALMQQLLTGKKRLKGFNGKWKKYKIHDVFERVIRKNNKGNKNIVTVSAQKGFVKQTEFFNKTIASECLDNYFVVEIGEFCYNKSYSNGYPWGAVKRLKEFDSAVVTTLYICFGIKNTNLASGDFFEHYFEQGSLDKGLTKIAHEGGRAHGLLNVTPSDFFSLEILIPAIEEQIAIANIINVSQKEIDILKHNLDLIKRQKKGLMQSLLTGKIRIN